MSSKCGNLCHLHSLIPSIPSLKQYIGGRQNLPRSRRYYRFRQVSGKCQAGQFQSQRWRPDLSSQRRSPAQQRGITHVQISCPSHLTSCGVITYHALFIGANKHQEYIELIAQENRWCGHTCEHEKWIDKAPSPESRQRRSRKVKEWPKTLPANPSQPLDFSPYPRLSTRLPPCSSEEFHRSFLHQLQVLGTTTSASILWTFAYLKLGF